MICQTPSDAEWIRVDVTLTHVNVYRWTRENATCSSATTSIPIVVNTDGTVWDSTEIVIPCAYEPEPEDRPTVAPWPFPPWPRGAVGRSKVRARVVPRRLAPTLRRTATGVRNWRSREALQ